MTLVGLGRGFAIAKLPGAPPGSVRVTYSCLPPGWRHRRES
jgi:hypothetical protein